MIDGRSGVRAGVQQTAPENRDCSSKTLTLAFATDPVMRWVYPDGFDYLVHFPALVEGYGGKAFDRESAQHLDGFTGAALWLPPGVSPDEEPFVDFLKRTLEPRKFQVALNIFEQMGNAHPTEPHWYLSLIGVDPGHQGKGLGSVLLGAMTERLDREGLPAYLESTNVRNLTIYERFGFERHGVIQVDDCPPLFPMFRPSRQAS
jgi:ribosomal protein S18 acetylase RimI-like enzyme